MLGFIQATKYFKTIHGIQVVLDNATFLAEKGQRIGILSGIGAGKSTIVKILSGVETLNKGVLIRECLTWPLGYSGVFHPFLTANENIKIIAGLYALDSLDLSIFCQDFAELSHDALNLTMRAHSGNMRAKLGFALSLKIPCDFFLADEKLTMGDDNFKAKCKAALEIRLQNSGLIFFSRNPKLTQHSCTRHGILQQGKIIMYDSFEAASHFFNAAKATI